MMMVMFIMTTLIGVIVGLFLEAWDAKQPHRMFPVCSVCRRRAGDEHFKESNEQCSKS